MRIQPHWKRAVAGCILTLCSSLHTIGVAAQQSGFDLVTTNNGDIFNGRIHPAPVTITTAFGPVTVPGDLVASIRRDRETSSFFLTTRLGDRFLGSLGQIEFTMLRVLDPPLPLAIADLRSLRFSDRPTDDQSETAPDSVETGSGDRFAARIQTTDFMLRGERSIQLLNRKEIRSMDFAPAEEEDAALVRIMLHNGRSQQGRAMTSRLRLTDRYGGVHQLPLTSLVTLILDSNDHLDQRPSFDRFTPSRQSPGFHDLLRDGSVGPELQKLAGGPFQRGDLQGDGDTDERPPTEIRLEPFAIGRYEITFDQYDLFCRSTGRARPDDEDRGRGRRPVMNVSWEDARAYTIWLSNQTGRRYRLPTDAEWEYAARGGSAFRFWWGEHITPDRANCSGCDTIWDGRMSSPVGSFPANAYGLYDTAGNVFEWTEDCWHDDYSQAPTDGSALRKEGCVMRVIRGGAWSFPPHEMRSANRWRDFHTRRSDDTGFRVVRELTGQEF